MRLNGSNIFHSVKYKEGQVKIKLTIFSLARPNMEKLEVEWTILYMFGSFNR